MPPNSRTEIPRPSQFGIKDFEELVIPTSDGEKLSAFYIRGPRGGRNAQTTVLMFHGNAGNIGHRLPIARMLLNLTGCNIFMLEYRGYGLSTGEPDEGGLLIDAQTALDYLRERAETSDHNLIVYGQSLGGAVSIKLVARNQHVGDIVGLVLENTFLSMRKLIPKILPPARYLTLLCHQVWPSDSVIPTITKVPILFLSGLQDEIVPYVPSQHVEADAFREHLSLSPPSPSSASWFRGLLVYSPSRCLPSHTCHPLIPLPLPPCPIARAIHQLLFASQLTIVSLLSPHHMRQLYELSAAPNKIWKPLPAGDHNSSVLEEGYFESISDFVASCTQDLPAKPKE